MNKYEVIKGQKGLTMLGLLSDSKPAQASAIV